MWPASFWPILAKHMPRFAQGQMWAKFGQSASLAEARTVLIELGQVRPHLGQHLADRVRTWPFLSATHVWSKFAKHQPSVATFRTRLDPCGRICQISGVAFRDAWRAMFRQRCHTRPLAAGIAKQGSIPNRCKSTTAEFGLSPNPRFGLRLAKFGPKSANIGPIDQIRATSVEQHRISVSGKHCRSAPDGPDLAETAPQIPEFGQTWTWDQI